jgi:hypothetical protein
MAESETAYAKETAAYAKVIARAWSDPAFKAQLLADPCAALAAMDAPVPNVAVKVVENTDTLMYLILPPRPAETGLSQEALEKAAAGHVRPWIVDPGPQPSRPRPPDRNI